MSRFALAEFTLSGATWVAVDTKPWLLNVRPRARFQALPILAKANPCEEGCENAGLVACILAIDYENGIDPGTPEELIAKQNALSINDAFYAAELRTPVVEHGGADSVLSV